MDDLARPLPLGAGAHQIVSLAPSWPCYLRLAIESPRACLALSRGHGPSSTEWDEILAKDTDYDRAFGTMVAERAGALVVLGSAILNVDRKRSIELAARYRLPAIYE